MNFSKKETNGSNRIVMWWRVIKCEQFNENKRYFNFYTLKYSTGKWYYAALIISKGIPYYVNNLIKVIIIHILCDINLPLKRFVSTRRFKI